jgi:hypothetical protein
MRPSVSRQVKQLIRGQKSPRAAMNDLFISWRWRPRAPTGIIDQYFDRRTVDNVETDNVTATVASHFETRRIQHQQIFEQLS